MNKKGELSVGLMISVFLGIIVALILYGASIGYVGSTTDTYVLVNKTFTSPTLNGRIDLTGQELIDTPIVTNATSGAVVTASNYTIAETVSTVDNLKRISYVAKDTNRTGDGINISYTYGAEGYADSAGARSIIELIAILAAVAVAVFAIYPTIKNQGYFDIG